MDRNISGWRREVLHHDEQPDTGLACVLFEAANAAFAALLRALVQDPARLNDELDPYQILHNEFQKFYMWNDSFLTSSGELDRILSCSRNLRAMILTLMVKWAKAVCRSKCAPFLNLSRLLQPLILLDIIFTNRYILLSSAGITRL